VAVPARRAATIPCVTEVRAPSRRARTAVAALVAMAVFAIAAMALAYLLSRGTDLGGRLDQQGLLRSDTSALPTARAASERFVQTVDRGALAVASLLIAAIAFARGRVRLGAAALVAIAGANVSTQILKPLLGDADPLATDAARALPAAFPSGHATVAMSVALGLVLVAPAAYRPLAALAGAGYAAGMGVALLALGWHYASDVAGGYLMATAWTAAAGAVALRWDPERASATRVRRGAVGAAVLGAGVLAALAVLGVAALVERPELLDVGRLRTTFVAASAGLAAAAVLLAAAVAAPLTAGDANR
jgi:membrane-associated phospholipid phosphatase